MLTNAGITSATTQLQIVSIILSICRSPLFFYVPQANLVLFRQNIILNAFCLVCSIFGTYIIDVWGRKPTAVVSTALLTIFLFMVGGLTKGT